VESSFEISSLEEQPEPPAKDIVILVVGTEVVVLFEKSRSSGPGGSSQDDIYGLRCMWSYFQGFNVLFFLAARVFCQEF